MRRRAVPVRAPAAGAAPVAALAHAHARGDGEHRSRDRQRAGAAGAWVRVRLPVLPNGTTGWVPRRALGGYGTVDTHLDVDLRRLRATLYRAGRPVFGADVGVGQARWPTPRGRFYIRNQLTRYRARPTARSPSGRARARRT